MADSTSSRASARTVVITIVSLVVLVALLAGTALSPLFAARTIEVSGEAHLSESDVLLAAGVSEDTNVLLMSTEDIQTALRSDPWIASSTVVRSLPSTVRIEVHERTPAALARQPDGFYLIASDGVTLESLPRDAAQDLPQVHGGKPAIPGERSEHIAGAAAAAASWDETVRAESPQVSVAADGTITVELSHGTPVLYGDATDPEAKGQALAGVLRWADENHEKIVSIDVRIPFAPAAEFEERGGGTSEVVVDEAAPPKHDPKAAEPTPSPSPKRDHAGAGTDTTSPNE